MNKLNIICFVIQYITFVYVQNFISKVSTGTMKMYSFQNME